jgi:hypothetical protein
MESSNPFSNGNGQKRQKDTPALVPIEPPADGPVDPCLVLAAFETLAARAGAAHV